MAVTFLARWYPKPERLQEFLGVIANLGANFPPDIAAGVGSITVSLNREGHFLAFEIWNDEEALNRLRASELFHDSIRKLSACCDRPLEFEHLDACDGDKAIFGRYPAGKANPKYYPDLGPMTPVWR